MQNSLKRCSQKWAFKDGNKHISHSILGEWLYNKITTFLVSVTGLKVPSSAIKTKWT